ncbi:hypothetical protein BC939DRAFT_296977 [Gamsiella multidivaricata]|uniref:uncharacterized protein n=1 Tax=Gamsiella multidivaricata TaxID=101098 RepID=UPI002220A55E|nr:uncharacterized protein BC939DRAFT_296977 [Gamsiella multidivaricata]KAI7818275.1 hypothetical protein BC939DRAFT_296977 [Gamsiella multidivaricata]
MVDVVMEHEYFGIQSHHEKYAVFDSTIAEYEFIQEEDDEAIRNAGTATLRTRRRQLEHMMNRLRGPRIGYGQGEYDRVAFLPKQFNLWLKGLVRWCDGLDLRMRPLEGASKGTSRWEELVVRYRSEQVSGGDSRARMYRKMNEGVEDEVDEDTMVRSEMVQVYRAHECPEQQQQGRWRSLPLRLTSPRQRKASLKEEKDGKADRDSKWRVLKIAAIIIVNAILLIKIAQAIENGAPPPPPQHWTKDMESYSGGSINNGTIDAATVAPEYNQPQELRRGENQEHREQAYSAVIVEEEEGGEDHYRRRGDHHHMRRREVRHHKERSHVRDWEPEGAI